MLTVRLDGIIRVIVVMGMLLASMPPRPAIAEPAHQPSSPAADFSGTPTSGEAPLTVVFTNGSSPEDFYIWDFGDGSTSTGTAPSHIYTQSGVYTVTLSAGNGVVTDTLVQPTYR